GLRRHPVDRPRVDARRHGSRSGERMLDELQRGIDRRRDELHAFIAPPPRTGLTAFPPPRCEARDDFEAAAPHLGALQGHRDRIGRPGRVGRRDARNLERSAGRVQRIVEVASAAVPIAEAARHVGKRSLLVRRERERQADQKRRERDYNSHCKESIPMRISRLPIMMLLGLAAAAVLVRAAAPADTVDVKIDEWLTPSKPPYPHDPAVAPERSVWYTGQRANVVGRFDPKTEQFKEYALPTPNSGPHGLQPDNAGNIWYTGNSAALIGKIDPKTGQITEYKMPDAKARDPHTIVFLRDGTLLFTVQAGNFVGHLDPKTANGNIRLVSPPTANARPYGIKLDSKEVAFFDEFNAPNIGSIDPKTMKITEYPLPDKAARPRRIAVAKDDTVWYGDYARGFLGHLDPKTGKVEEFASPGGPTSKPYAIDVTSDGAIWYVETGDD